MCRQMVWGRPRMTHTVELAEGCDPYFRLPLFLKAQIAGKEIWAVNVPHLLDLRMYLGAILRERRSGLSLTAMKRLPSWMKSASMRPKVVRALDRMFETAMAHRLN